jgi:hypothetical protein
LTDGVSEHHNSEAVLFRLEVQQTDRVAPPSWHDSPKLRAVGSYRQVEGPRKTELEVRRELEELRFKVAQHREKPADVTLRTSG